MNKVSQSNVERLFIGIENIEEVLKAIINHHIEKLVNDIYYNDKANTIPSEIETEGVKQ